MGGFSFVLRKIAQLGEYQSGQLGQTVNLLSYDFIGSNPISPTCPTKPWRSWAVRRSFSEGGRWINIDATLLYETISSMDEKKISHRSEDVKRAMHAFAKATAGDAGVAQLVER